MSLHLLLLVALAGPGEALELGLAGQVRAELAPTREEDPWLSELEVPRIRTKLRAPITDALAAAIQLNTSPDKVEWVDLYVDARLGDTAKLRAGQHKIGFTAYRQQSNFDLVLTDWSPVTRFFGAERQWGATYQHQVGPWVFTGGTYVGDNARASHGIGASLLAGEEPGNRSSWIDRAPYDRLHPELTGRAELVGSLGRLGASAAWDSRAGEDDFRARAALEAVLTLRNVQLWAVGYGASTDGDRLEALGALIELSYPVHGPFALGARYALLEISRAQPNPLAPRRHEAVVGARYDATEHVTLQAEGGLIFEAGQTEAQGRAQLSFTL